MRNLLTNFFVLLLLIFTTSCDKTSSLILNENVIKKIEVDEFQVKLKYDTKGDIYCLNSYDLIRNDFLELPFIKITGLTRRTIKNQSVYDFIVGPGGNGDIRLLNGNGEILLDTKNDIQKFAYYAIRITKCSNLISSKKKFSVDVYNLKFKVTVSGASSP